MTKFDDFNIIIKDITLNNNNLCNIIFLVSHKYKDLKQDFTSYNILFSESIKNVIDNAWKFIEPNVLSWILYKEFRNEYINTKYIPK